MGSYKKRCNRILKQYGKNIKAFDNRIDNPLDDKEIKQTCEKYGLAYQRRVELSWFAKRTQAITCYNDLEVYANG